MSIYEIQISKNGITGSKDTRCISNFDFSFKLETDISKQVPMDASKMVIWLFPGKCLQHFKLSKSSSKLIIPSLPSCYSASQTTLVSITL